MLLRSSRTLRNWTWISHGFFPSLLPSTQFLDIAIVHSDGWRSHVHGLEIAINDFLALALLIALPRNRSLINYHLPLVLNLGALVLATFQASHPLESSYSVFQCVRVYLLVAVVARGCADDDVPVHLLKGLALGLALQLTTMVLQIRGGVIQPSGTFAHQNTLGMVVHLVALPHFALFLAGARGLQFWIVPPLALVVASLTASRGSFFFVLAGFGLTFVLSTMRHLTARKAALAAAGLVVLALVAPLASSSFERRFAADPLKEHEYDERAAFNRTASYILADNPWGIGNNHYVHVAKNGGYSVRAGVLVNEVNLNNIVHNAYWLTAAETGYFGLVALLIYLVYPIVLAGRAALRGGGTLAGDLLLGNAAALIIVCQHSLYEYIIHGEDVQYVLAIIIGTIFGLASRVLVRTSARPGRAPLSAGFARIARAGS